MMQSRRALIQSPLRSTPPFDRPADDQNCDAVMLSHWYGKVAYNGFNIARKALAVSADSSSVASGELLLNLLL